MLVLEGDMSHHVAFETPENIHVRYNTAGLGSRFIAWIVDQILLAVVMVLLFIVAIGAGVAGGWIDRLESLLSSEEGQSQAAYYIFGLLLLALGLGGFVYYSALELLMRGQTPGKRSVGIRVVKVDGFSLDASSILIRNLFRVVDQIPVVWIVPFLSEKSQRLGDLVANTVVIADEKLTLSPVRQYLLQQSSASSTFSFTVATLRKAKSVDFEAVEMLLERWSELSADEREAFLNRICHPLAQRLGVEPPTPELRFLFLQEFLAAELRRRYRNLG
jgi:uncharacterized RDD family membrane protein YckC